MPERRIFFFKSRIRRNNAMGADDSRPSEPQPAEPTEEIAETEPAGLESQTEEETVKEQQ